MWIKANNAVLKMLSSKSVVRPVYLTEFINMKIVFEVIYSSVFLLQRGEFKVIVYSYLRGGGISSDKLCLKKLLYVFL